MKKPLVLVAVILGVLFFICAIIYFIEPARSLPLFFPGYDGTLSQHHYKHGIASLALAIGAFVYVWFQTGKKEAK